MGFSTETQIRRVLNTYGITDAFDDDRDGSADSGLITGAILDADYEAESYIVGRYPTYTVAYAGTVPEVLKLMTSRLAAANALMRQGRGRLATWREETVDWFKALAAGDVNLAGVSDAGLPESTTREVTQEFSYRTLNGLGEPSPTEFDEGDENDPLD